MKNILVAGGAGYVGSHTCLRLREAGFRPVVYDDLSNGHEEFAKFGPLVCGDIRDADHLAWTFRRFQPDAVMHFAARIEVGESVRDPAQCFDINVGGSATLFRAAREAGIDKLVMSSTCAIFGEPESERLTEEHPQKPISPYGQSKKIVEDMLLDLERFAGLRSARLRYFNAAGADPAGRLGERHDPETHLIPLALAAASGQNPNFRILGTDYDTRDGTAERDFVHVLDLADAHIRALRLLDSGAPGFGVNLGSGRGATVREVERACARAVGATSPPKRRRGAPAIPQGWWPIPRARTPCSVGSPSVASTKSSVTPGPGTAAMRPSDCLTGWPDRRPMQSCSPALHTPALDPAPSSPRVSPGLKKAGAACPNANSM
jgi:UDP-glucose 4-epimerase